MVTLRALMLEASRGRMALPFSLYSPSSFSSPPSSSPSSSSSLSASSLASSSSCSSLASCFCVVPRWWVASIPRLRVSASPAAWNKNQSISSNTPPPRRFVTACSLPTPASGSTTDSTPAVLSSSSSSPASSSSASSPASSSSSSSPASSSSASSPASSSGGEAGAQTQARQALQELSTLLPRGPMAKLNADDVATFVGLLALVKDEITVCAIVASSVVATYTVFGVGNIEPIGHSSLATLTSFFLVFRASHAYNRWWEGRGLLGAAVSSLVETAQKVSAQLNPDFTPAPMTAVKGNDCVSCSATIRVEMARRLRLVMNAHVEFLRAGSGDAVIATAAFPDATDQEREILRKSPVPGALALQWAEGYLARLSTQPGVFINNNPVTVESLQRSLASAAPPMVWSSKLITTPYPAIFSTLSEALTSVLLYTFPFVLVKPMGILTIPVTTILGASYFAVNKLSKELENPFGRDDYDHLKDDRIQNSCYTIINSVLTQGPV